MIWFTTFVVILILIFINALFVAAEFSTVSARRSRLAQWSDEGNKSAAAILTIVEDPHKLDAYIATCQVGITISSLVLGYYGQAQLSQPLTPLFERFGDLSEVAAASFSATFVLVILSIFQVLLGELVPKNIGIQLPEQIATLTFRPVRWAQTVFKPLNQLFNGSGFLLMRLLNIEPANEHTHVHSPEEVIMLVEESRAGGVLPEEEHLLLQNMLQLGETTVKQIMIPRTAMLSAPASLPPEALFKILAESPYSRMPVYKDTIDNVVGVIHLRDLLCYKENHYNSIAEITYSAPFIPENMPVREVFNLLQKRQFQVAIVIDEFGGTAGLIAMEDLLEEIFGDLQDEFDPTAQPVVWQLAPNRIGLRGDVGFEDIAKGLGIDPTTNSAETLAGALMVEAGYFPQENDEIFLAPVHFQIEKIVRRQIVQVSCAGDGALLQKLKDTLE